MEQGIFTVIPIVKEKDGFLEVERQRVLVLNNNIIKISNLEYDILKFMIYNVLPNFKIDDKYLGIDIFINSKIVEVSETKVKIIVRHCGDRYYMITIEKDGDSYDEMIYKLDIDKMYLNLMSLRLHDSIMKLFGRMKMDEIIKKLFELFYRINIEETFMNDIEMRNEKSLFINVFPCLINDDSYYIDFFYAPIRGFDNGITVDRRVNKCISRIMLSEIDGLTFFLDFICPNIKIGGIRLGKSKKITFKNCGVFSIGISYEGTKNVFLKVIRVDRNLNQSLHDEINCLKRIQNMKNNVIPSFYGYLTSYCELSNGVYFNFDNIELNYSELLDDINKIDKRRLTIDELMTFIKKMYSRLMIIMMEDADGSLVKFLKDTKYFNGYEETVSIKNMIYDLVNCLNGIHEINICHMDLKIDNIVFFNGFRTKFRLIDFGLAKSLYEKIIHGAYRCEENVHDFYEEFNIRNIDEFFDSIGFIGTVERNKLYDYFCLVCVISNVLCVDAFYYIKNKIKLCNEESKTLIHYEYLLDKSFIGKDKTLIICEMIDVLVGIMGFSGRNTNISDYYYQYDKFLDKIIEKYNIKITYNEVVFMKHDIFDKIVSIITYMNFI